MPGAKVFKGEKGGEIDAENDIHFCMKKDDLLAVIELKLFEDFPFSC